MLVMFDTTTPDQLPNHPQAVAGYVSGRWPDYGTIRKLYPHAKHLSISTNVSTTADCLDIESGDAKPVSAPDWYRRAVQENVWRPCFYADLSTMPEVRKQLDAAGIDRADYRLWVADWTHTPHLPDGYDACQWTDKALGRNLDESLCAPDFFPQRRRAVPVDLVAEVRVDRLTGAWEVRGLPAGSGPLG